MELPEKIKAVEELFVRLDDHIRSFQQHTSLHCKAGCGKCCFKADIEATVLEFLPFAFYLHTQGKADEWYERLRQTDSSICLILNPAQAGAGLCSEYPHRGLICRLFGYSARTTKYGQRELVTCQIIKTEQTPSYQQAASEIEAGTLAVPVMNEYYMQLHAIDFELARDFYPINTAIKKALETVLQYMAYR
ncbi:MAG: YkgJ family cysteine cluster protein [Cyclobacteriaceae bacterium]|nr:YkgJ family cysteine cluster protein [Cyclobacteriaceae bacterium]